MEEYYNYQYDEWGRLKRHRIEYEITKKVLKEYIKQIYHDCFRTRPIQDVIEEIRRMPSRFFVFWDDNLSADIDYAKNLLRALTPLKRKWAAQVTLIDCNDEELLSLAKAAGCMYLFIGLESFSEDSLTHAGKKSTGFRITSH